ncbi:MAG: efflux RND transporter permease subunit [Desulfobacterales bacterium]|nr:efflux RND transporter permease subunit [Desulfobacterales bacterium]
MKPSPSPGLSPAARFFFVNRIPGILLVLILVISGAMGYRAMVKEALPDLAIPMAAIHTFWHGASPSIMEKEVTNKIEKEVRDMKGLKRFSSGSMFANSYIFVEFEPDAGIAESMDLLRQRVAAAEGKLHRETEKPGIEQVSMRDAPIASFVLYGDIDHTRLSGAALWLERELSRINGVQKVLVYGNRKEYVRVQLIPERLKALNIDPALVFAKLRERELDAPLGVYESRDLPFTVKSGMAFHDLRSIRELPLRRTGTGEDGDRVIRLREVARVDKALRRQEAIASFSIDGSEFKNGVALSIIKGQGRDTIALVDKVVRTMNQLKTHENWPPGMAFTAVADNAEIMKEELGKSLVSGMQSVAVVFCVLFFLLTWREAVVAALSIPITLLGTTAVLWAMGETFNIMTIIGIVLALGLLVDDFILMMEGMHDGIFIKKLPFPKAAVRTVKHYALPSFSGSLTTIMVFIPLAAISGLDGKFIRIIPLTAAVCLVISYLVSVLIDIPLSRFVLAGRAGAPKTPWIDRVSCRAETWLKNYLTGRVLTGKFRIFSLTGIALGMVALSIYLALFMPVILYPLADGRDVGITVELPVNIKLEESHAVAGKVGEVLREKPYIRSILRITGRRDYMFQGSSEDRLSVNAGPHFIGYTLLLTPKKEREKLGYEYLNELERDIRQVLGDTPGFRVYLTADTGGSTNEAPVQINLSGPDMDVLQEISEDLRREMSTLEGIFEVRDNLGQAGTEMVFSPIRESLDFYGIEEERFNAQLTLYLGDSRASYLRSGGTEDDLEVRVETFWESQKGRTGGPAAWEEFQGMSILAPDGTTVPVHALAVRRINQAPKAITHKKGVRSITVSAKTYTLTFAQTRGLIDPILKQMQQTWPKGYEYGFSGEEELAEEAFGNAEKAFILAFVMVFGILALQFNSFAQPAIILVSVFFGISGVIYGFILFAIPFSFTAAIGVIALIGININDAIVMVDTMNRHLKQGAGLTQAAASGAAERLRPIVSTSITTILGLAPLALAEEGWRPLCLAIIFGELVSTVTSLVLIPCLYHLFTPGSGARQDPAATKS